MVLVLLIIQWRDVSDEMGLMGKEKKNKVKLP